MSATRKADRVFVQNGRRLYRKTFSTTETRLGILTFLALCAIIAWVAWKGAHPDPSLFALDTDLSQAAGTRVADRGPVPNDIVAAGWSEREVSQFDNSNLYEKINGREGYYKSFGFERLYFLSLLKDDDALTAVDIELYDLGNSANALGAYSGERSADARPVASETGMTHLDRNALYLTRGRYYLRAIGSDESPEVRAQLELLQSRFAVDLPGEALPWGYALFVGRLGLDPGVVSFMPENAFSFGFATNVYSATLASEAEPFVTPAGNAQEANALAERFREGFRQYGDDEGDFIKDRYVGTYATATATGTWVVGVTRAPDAETASEAVEQLVAVVRQLDPPQDAAAGNATPGAETESTEPEPSDNVEDSYGNDGY